MFEIIGFWVSVSIFTFTMIVPVWFGVSWGISHYIGLIYSKAFLSDDSPSSWGRPSSKKDKFSKSLYLKLVKPVDHVFNKVGMGRDAYGMSLPQSITILVGMILWLGLTMFAFLPARNSDGDISSHFAEYGYTGSHVHHIAELSAFAATWLTFPVLVVLGLLLAHTFLVKGVKYGSDLVAKINKITGTD